MKRGFRILFILAIVLSFATTIAAASNNILKGYIPDITDVQFAEELVTTDITQTALLPVRGFWTDLVNTENISADGEGVYVAVLDTGLVPEWPFFFSEADIAWELGMGFTHTIEEAIWTGSECELILGDLLNNRGFITDLGSGHGTHVTSTVVGYNYNNLYWIEGVAPKATIIPVLVLDAWEKDGCREFYGTDEMVSAGIIYVADLADSLEGPVVINMSLGGPEKSPMIEAAVDYAIERGVIVVASAGNEGSIGMGYPGGLEQIISAGAAGWTTMFNNHWTGDVPEKLNKGDELGNNWQIYLEDFSSRPNKDLDQKHQDLDVTAPGAWIVGPYKPSFDPSSVYLGYYYVSGTSMAAPHVSGMAALVLGEYPGVAQFEMEFILEKAAAGFPLPASDAIVAFPYVLEGYYTAMWDGGDYGSGFLQADQALKTAGKFVK